MLLEAVRRYRRDVSPRRGHPARSTLKKREAFLDARHVAVVIRGQNEDLIDPWLRVLSFWQEHRPLAALNYYATHPMSYYGRGHVSSDFCGLRKTAAGWPWRAKS